MAKNVVQIQPNKPELQQRSRVAAYARVSCGKDTMLHSLAAQMDGQSLGTVTTSTTNGWTAAHFDLRLGSGGHVLALQGASAGKTTVVDSVTLRCLRKMPSGMTIVIK